MSTLLPRLPSPVFTLVKAQAGVMRREQLHALGVSARTLQRRTADGLFQPRGRKVLVFAGTPAGLVTDSLVAAHMAHPDGVLTGYSAIAVLGRSAEDPWSVVSPPQEPWLRLVGHQRLPARVIRGPATTGQRVLGVAVADEDQIVVDLLRFLPWADAETLAYRLAQRHGVSLFTALDGAVGNQTRARGVRQLRRVLELLRPGARSHAEREIVHLVTSAGFTGFRLNHPVRVGGRLFHLDLADPEAMLAIEVDGQAFHTDAKAFQADRTRQNLLVAAGWTVLRFTWHDIMQRPQHVLSQIARQR